MLLVEPGIDADGAPTLEPVHLHAGGIVWHGPWLHLAATARGLVSCRVDDILPVADPDVADRLGVADGRVTAYGHRFVLPVRRLLRGGADRGHERFRYSFLALDRSEETPALVSGEYARGDRTRRLVRYELDPDDGAAPRRTRTASPGRSRWPRASAGCRGWWSGKGQHLVSVSNGPWLPGTDPRRVAPAPAAPPAGGADGARGPHLLALDRPGLVGDRAPAPPVVLRDAPRLVRLSGPTRGRACRIPPIRPPPAADWQHTGARRRHVERGAQP